MTPMYLKTSVLISPLSIPAIDGQDNVPGATRRTLEREAGATPNASDHAELVPSCSPKSEYLTSSPAPVRDPKKCRTLMLLERRRPRPRRP